MISILPMYHFEMDKPSQANFFSPCAFLDAHFCCHFFYTISVIWLKVEFKFAKTYE